MPVPMDVIPPLLLHHVPVLIHSSDMNRFAPSFADAPDISAALLSSPGWARVGLTAPTEAIRLRAAEELAHAIVERLASAEPADPDQFVLQL